MKKILLMVSLMFTLLSAETKIEIYRIPLGSFMEANSEQDIQNLNENLKKMDPILSYKEKSSEQMIKHRNIKVFLNKKTSKKENYNQLLDIVIKYSKELKNVDHKVIEKMLERLKV